MTQVKGAHFLHELYLAQLIINCHSCGLEMLSELKGCNKKPCAQTTIKSAITLPLCSISNHPLPSKSWSSCCCHGPCLHNCCCHSFQGQPWLRAHCKTSKCPPSTARVHVCSFQGQPWPLNHCNTSKWPPPAAWAHVCSFQGQPWLLSHCNTFKWPPRATSLHICLLSQGQPWLRAHCNTFKWPPSAALEHVHTFQGQPWLLNHCNTFKWPP